MAMQFAPPPVQQEDEIRAPTWQDHFGRIIQTISDKIPKLQKLPPGVQPALDYMNTPQGQLATSMPGMVASVLPSQVLAEMRKALARPNAQLNPQAAPRNLQALIQQLESPSIQAWAADQWKNVGGSTPAETLAYKVGAEAFPTRVMSYEDRRDPMTVLKLFAGDVPGAMKAYRQATENIPGVLPTLNHGLSPTQSLAWIEQPHALLPTERQGADPMYMQNVMRGIQDKLGPAGYRWQDFSIHNIGEHQGKWHAIDTGAVTPIHPPVAPAQFYAMQPVPGRDPFEYWNLTGDVIGHPAGSTVSRRSLEDLGYYVPPRPK